MYIFRWDLTSALGGVEKDEAKHIVRGYFVLFLGKNGISNL